MFWLIGIIATAVVSYLLYERSENYEVSGDSKIALFEMIFPFLEKKPRICYILFSILLFAVFFYFLPFTVLNAIVFLLMLVMQMIVFIDIKCFRLPNLYVLPLIPIALLVSSFNIGFIDSLIGGVVAFFIVLILGMIRVGGLGGGDLKFAVVLGMLLGAKYVVIALCLMFIFGGLFSFIFLIRKIVSRKDYIPYGPFLFLGFVVSFIWFYS